MRRQLERRQPVVELTNPDDPSGDVEISAPEPESPAIHSTFLLAAIWGLPDPAGPAAAQQFAYGTASVDVRAVRWASEDERAYTCATVPVPGEQLYRAFIMPIGPCDRGTFAALDADGAVLRERAYGGTLRSDQPPPEEFERWRALPKIGEGPLPDGGRWELQAGMVGDHLYKRVRRAPRGGGGGSGGPVMADHEVIALSSVGDDADGVQIAVGQVAKHVVRVEAFDEDGARRHAERIPAAHLAVDCFLAWTPGPALRRVLAWDRAGERLTEVEVPTMPPPPGTE